jgi:TRAP-type C4-dicarboxylate transport system permease large subunit
MKTLTVIILLIVSIPAFSQTAEPVKMPDFNKFDKVRTTGKALQLIGTAGLFTYYMMNKKYQDRIADGDMKAKQPSVVIPIVSTGFIGVGLVIDMSAGIHLKRKK